MASFYLRVYDVRVRLANDGTIKKSNGERRYNLNLLNKKKVNRATRENVFVESKQ